MNAFQRVPPDARENQIYRDALLAQPPEFFRTYFGAEPDITQRLFLVEKLIHTLAAPKVYVNDTYRVRIRDAAPYLQLDISRLDGEPCTSWRDFQQIKNELVGIEYEGVELFPAESRLVDTANQYHLWVMPQISYRFPFGYQNRLVLDEPVIYRGKAGDLPNAQAQSLALDSAHAAAHS
jgi:hypothetical protein